MSTALSHSSLIAHWPLQKNTEDCGPARLRAINHNVRFAPSPRDGKNLAQFNGQDSFLEILDHPALCWADSDFSVAAWIETEASTDVVGDIISKFDGSTRRGWSLNVVTNTGVTSTAQANYRNLHFGVDSGVQSEKWQDCGRPGNAVLIYSLATINGLLYAGTFEKEAGQTGHVWRYEGNGKWVDCGANPDGSNAVPSVIGFEGEIYCSTGRYNPVGSRLGPPQNTLPGGHVYRIESDGTWVDCGQPGHEDATPESTYVEGYETGKADEVCGLTVYRGQLYATSFHRRGAFVYEGGQNWKYIGPDERLMSFVVYRDRLYTLVNGGPVMRYEGGQEWTHCGTPGHSEQTYAAATYKGDLLVGTWPECEVQRYEGEDRWKNLGRVGYEREVMAMALYNAKVYVGTLPMANVFRLEEGEATFVGNLDNSSDVFLRRVWSMAVHDGKLFAGTLPSGRVLSFEAGRLASHNSALPAGRHHVAAVRHGSTLRLYLDGKQVAQSSSFRAEDFDLNNERTLKIGFGPHQFFSGAMSDLRLYRCALTGADLEQLVEKT